jgi:transposase-like protein
MNPLTRSDPAGGAASGQPTCPACRSSSVTTTAKRPDVSSYWRCERCGEVWNVDRRNERPGRPFPWR